jgi:hypothetical protein
MESPLQASKNYVSATQDSDRVCCAVEQNHQQKTLIHYKFHSFTVHFYSLSLYVPTNAPSLL